MWAESPRTMASRRQPVQQACANGSKSSRHGGRSDTCRHQRGRVAAKRRQTVSMVWEVAHCRDAETKESLPCIFFSFVWKFNIQIWKFGDSYLYNEINSGIQNFHLKYNSLKSPITCVSNNLALKAASSTKKLRIDVFKLKYETFVCQSHESPIPSFYISSPPNIKKK